MVSKPAGEAEAGHGGAEAGRGMHEGDRHQQVTAGGLRQRGGATEGEGVTSDTHHVAAAALVARHQPSKGPLSGAGELAATAPGLSTHASRGTAHRRLHTVPSPETLRRGMLIRTSACLVLTKESRRGC